MPTPEYTPGSPEWVARRQAEDDVRAAAEVINVDLAPGEEVVANSPVASRLAAGRFYIASTGRMTLGVAGNVRLQILNPAGSGRKLNLVRIASLSTAVSWATVFLNPTAGVPTGAVRPRLNGIAGGGVAGLGELRADTSATTPLSGGVDTGIVIGMAGNVRSEITLPPLVLAPGVSMGINIPFTGAGDATASLYWFEDDL